MFHLKHGKCKQSKGSGAKKNVAFNLHKNSERRFDSVLLCRIILHDELLAIQTDSTLSQPFCPKADFDIWLQ